MKRLLRTLVLATAVVAPAIAAHAYLICVYIGTIVVCNSSGCVVIDVYRCGNLV
jgi:hypothetical protein